MFYFNYIIDGIKLFIFCGKIVFKLIQLECPNGQALNQSSVEYQQLEQADSP
jgi:hypothetical protein